MYVIVLSEVTPEFTEKYHLKNVFCGICHPPPPQSSLAMHSNTFNSLKNYTPMYEYVFTLLH